MKRTAVWLLGAGLICAGCSGKAEAPRASNAGSGEFRAIEEEIFVTRCLGKGCHSGLHPAGELNLSKGEAYGELVAVPSQRRPERLRVAPGDPDASYLVQRLSPEGDTPRMPMMAQALTSAEVERIRAWIRDGAKR